MQSRTTVLSPNRGEWIQFDHGRLGLSEDDVHGYFYAVMDTPVLTFKVWHDPLPALPSNVVARRNSDEGGSGASFTYNTHVVHTVQMKMGISFLSVEQAKRNVMEEITSFNFATTKTAAEAAWEKALAPVAIEGASEDDLRQFYTAIYHTMLMPTDHKGENPLWKSDEPSYDDYYAIWDTFRSSTLLPILIAPGREAGMCRVWWISTGTRVR